LQCGWGKPENACFRKRILASNEKENQKGQKRSDNMKAVLQRLSYKKNESCFDELLGVLALSTIISSQLNLVLACHSG
jgi:hypothetical protein